eukprot:gnl/TRDRNA2_/TRDRNA2_91605_c0_seq1.p1 gnl/TRDRNA2_/TRDRNA2_91605_c0~~gnl/TRDRNA2_/TRDRNA2_91605_c0_seq1.p1  ORF type:complete len:224 (-),score=35.60 gnl/TRDRNA2_/TRDRNA2_91605_c0_seq1:2-673(-)
MSPGCPGDKEHESGAQDGTEADLAAPAESDTTPVCRICLEQRGTSDGETPIFQADPLISPCPCRGSQRYVHASCILRAFLARGQWDAISCPTCRHEYEGPVAVRLAQVALERTEHDYGEDSPQVATALCNLGMSFGSVGKHEKQRELLEHALMLKELSFGPNHRQVATTLANLGNAYAALGQPEEQQRLLERALRIQEVQCGPQSYDVAITLTILGRSCWNMH